MGIIDALRREEASILAELRREDSYRRLEAVRSMLRLYDEAPPVGMGFDALIGEAARRGGTSAPPPRRGSEVA